MRLESETEVDYISFNFNCDREIRLPLHLKNAVHSDALLLIAAYDKIGVSPYFDNKEKNEHLLACLISVLEDRAERQRFSPLTLKIMKYIRQNMDNKITLEDISKLTFFSSVYCDTVFKRETGKTLSEYIREKRMQMASHLLATTQLQIQSVATRCGIMDVQYFSKMFKAATGTTPKEYREMQKRK
jgi:YesN/AraC family two-component response regulator